MQEGNLFFAQRKVIKFHGIEHDKCDALKTRL